MREINRIFVHCSATKEGQDFTANDIRQWHLDRGWNDIGYHKVIRLDGKVEAGRPEKLAGAHAYGNNSDSLGVVYVGGLDSKGNSKDTRTFEQKMALYETVSYWMDKYSVPVDGVIGHYEVAAKDCPCFDMDQFRSGLAEYRMAIVENEKAEECGGLCRAFKALAAVFCKECI